MNIQPVSYFRQSPKFKANADTQKRENPIDRKTERDLSVLGTVAKSAGVGTIAAGIATCIINEQSAHRYLKAGGVGLLVALGTLLLTLPSKLYDTKVKSFTREKEMEVYSADKNVQTKLYDELDTQVQDEDTPLGEKIGNYATLQMAQNGSGLLVKQN